MLLRKISFIAFILSMMVLLPITAAEACLPGCPCNTVVPASPNSSVIHDGLLGAMEGKGDAQRVRDKAVTTQITKQSENSMGMTCFDSAIALSANLGEMFSDKLESPPEPADENSFGPVSFPAFGAGQIMLEQINNVLDGPMSDHSANFSHSLSHMLGAGDLLNGAIQTYFLGPLTAYTAAINGLIGTLTTAMGTVAAAMAAVEAAVALIGGTFEPFTSILIAAVNAAIAFLDGVINGIITGILSTIQGIISSLLDPLMALLDNAMSGALSALFGNPCERLMGLWGDGFDVTTIFTPLLGPFGELFEPLIGGGLEANSNYFNFQDLVAAVGTGSGTIPGIGNSRLLTEVMNATNDTILNRAYQDLQGLLTGPGSLITPNPILPDWMLPVTLPAAPLLTAQDVINAM